MYMFNPIGLRVNPSRSILGLRPYDFLCFLFQADEVLVDRRYARAPAVRCLFWRNDTKILLPLAQVTPNRFGLAQIRFPIGSEINYPQCVVSPGETMRRSSYLSHR